MKALIYFWVIFCASFIQAEPVSRLTVYVYPPSTLYDESTPKSLVNGFLYINARETAVRNSPEAEFVSDFNEPGTINSFFLSVMGHTMNHVQCRMSNGQWYDRWASLTGMEFMSNTFKNIFFDELGLGYVMYDYKDGHILSGAENWMRLTYYRGPVSVDKNGFTDFAHPRYIEFRVQPKDCDELHKMVTFYESFHYSPSTSYGDLDEKNPEDVLYFSPNYMPYESYKRRIQTGHGKVGGGCATFGAGLIQAAGKLEPELDLLIHRRFAISEKLIGGTRVKETGETRRVSLPELMFTSLGDHWNYPGVRDEVLDGYEPKKIWDFLGSAMRCLKNNRKNCAGDMTAWLNKKGPKVTRGPRQYFEDTIQDSKNYLYTSQPIDGIVVDL